MQVADLLYSAGVYSSAVVRRVDGFCLERPSENGEDLTRDVAFKLDPTSPISIPSSNVFPGEN